MQLNISFSLYNLFFKLKMAKNKGIFKKKIFRLYNNNSYNDGSYGYLIVIIL